MKKYLNVWTAALALVIAFSFTSCKKESTTTPPDGGPVQEANVVTGTAVDPQGKPLAGVKVRAENPSGVNIYAEGTTDANGKYKIKLSSIGGWKIYAWKEVTYKDKT